MRLRARDRVRVRDRDSVRVTVRVRVVPAALNDRERLKARRFTVARMASL